MSNEFSIDKLFSKAISKEQFIETYLKNTENMSEEQEISIFGNKLSGAIGEIFELADTTKDGQLDENEINAVKQLFDDKDNSETITKNDITELTKQAYQNIEAKYKNLTPEEMYNQNMTGDLISNTYIQTLSENIEIVENMILSKQIDSEKVIQQYENEINDLIQNSSALSQKFKNEYKKTKQEAEKYQKLITENKLNLEKANQQIAANESESLVITNSIKGYNSEDGNENSMISDSQKEIQNLQSKNNDIKENISKYTNNINTFTAKYSELQAKLASMQQDAINQDSSLKSQINNKKTQIEMERTNTKNVINGYKTTLNKLNTAKTYALNELLKQQAQETSDLTFDNDGRNVAALKDVNYNSEKGQKLASYMNKHKVGFTGYCARYVNNGLKACGLGNDRGNAKDMDTKLRNNKNFQEVKINSAEDLKNLPAGCIIVYEAGAAGYSSRYGHIEVAMGNGNAVSDGVTHNMKYAKNMSVFVPV